MITPVNSGNFQLAPKTVIEEKNSFQTEKNKKIEWKSEKQKDGWKIKIYYYMKIKGINILTIKFKIGVCVWSQSICKTHFPQFIKRCLSKDRFPLYSDWKYVANTEANKNSHSDFPQLFMQNVQYILFKTFINFTMNYFSLLKAKLYKFFSKTCNSFCFSF